jgi:hypothetical protein
MWTIMQTPTMYPGVAATGLGAWKLPITVEDPGGNPGTGLVHLRGGIQFMPGHAWGPGPRKVFSLPVGMRPKGQRWFVCVILRLIGPVMPPTDHIVARVTGGGDVELMGGGNEDCTFFFDGVSFLAEQ